MLTLFNQGQVTSMLLYDSHREGVQDGIQIGQQEGIQKGMQALVETCQAFGRTPVEARLMLVKKNRPLESSGERSRKAILEGLRQTLRRQ